MYGIMEPVTPDRKIIQFSVTLPGEDVSGRAVFTKLSHELAGNSKLEDAAG